MLESEKTIEISFNQLSDRLCSDLKTDEVLLLYLKGERSQFIRFNNSKVRQTGLINDANLRLTLHKGRRTCQGSITFIDDPDEDSKHAQVELLRLREEVTQLPEDPFFLLPQHTESSRVIKTANGLDMNQAVNALLPPMQGVDLTGIWASGRIFCGSADSSGHRHWFETDTFALDYSLITSDHRMVKGNFFASDWDQTYYENALVKSKKQLKILEKDTAKIKPGEYRVWIAPTAVAEFFSVLSWKGFSEALIQQGNSGLIKMHSEGVKLSPIFNVSEDFSAGLVPRFNERGEVTPEVLPLIRNGELVNTLISSRSAKEYHKESNFATEREYLRTPTMSAGDLNDEKILYRLGTGLYISNLHYLNWSDIPGGRITGLTRYACFWITDGEIVAPIETMRFDDTIYRIFGSELEAIGNKAKLIPDVSTYEGRELGNAHCPGILVNSFALTL